MKISATSIHQARLPRHVAMSKQTYGIKFAPDGSMSLEPVEKANVAKWLLAPVPPAAIAAYRYANVASPDQYIALFNQSGFTPTSAQTATSLVQNNITILKGTGLFVAVGTGSYLLIDGIAPSWELWKKLTFACGVAAIVVALYALGVHVGIMK